MKSNEKLAKEKLSEIGYTARQIKTLMPTSGTGYYGLAGGVSAEKMLEMSNEELEKLCEKILNVQYD